MAVIESAPIPLTFEERIEAKLSHLPLERLNQGVVFDSSFDAELHVGALQAGEAIVCKSHLDELTHVKSHEVFPDKTIERRRSAHGVSFGRLIGFKASKKRDGNLMSVAYKPFDRAEKAIQELYGYRILQELGVETFDPIGVVPSENDEGYVVITQKRDDLMSLDRDEWVVGRQPRDEREVEIAERNNTTVSEIASTLAHLHAAGVFHPDGQIKNFAVTVNGTVGVIDTENLHVRNTDDLDNPALAWNDIQKLTRSLILDHSTEENTTGEDKIFGVGMLANMNLPQLRNACWELIFEPYIRTLEEHIKLGEDSDYLTTLAYQLQEEFERDDHWPLNLVTSV